MQLPIDDAVLLSLLVLFFAVQQRHRPESYFRFWLAGWALLLVSVMARMWMHYGVALKTLECVREDALVCGGVVFQFSSLVSGERRRAAIKTACAIAVPVCLGLDLIVVGWTPTGVMALLVVVGQGTSLAYAYWSCRGRAWWLMATITSLSLGHGALMMDIVVKGRLANAEHLVLSQLFLTAGFLLLGKRKANPGCWVGALGFFGWGLFHLLVCDFFPARLQMEPLFNLWMIPKYLVAFGMILQIFAEKNVEIAGLGTLYRGLYEDFRILYQGNPHPMWVYDASSLRFLSVNDAAMETYGLTEQEFLSRKVGDLVAGIEKEATGLEVSAAGAARKAPGRHRRANGTVFDVDLTEHTIHFKGADARFVLAVDITEREDLNRELMYQAQHDVLTGLPNRMVLEDRLVHWLARCGRESTMGALLTIDIDHFKRVNDTYGHLVGDDCLKAVADRLRGRVRSVDTIARTGGEEFTIVVGNLRSREGAEKVCRLLLQVFQDPIMVEEIELKVTISIGAALYPDDGVQVDVLRRRSDQALYEAKRSGRNRVVFARRELEGTRTLLLSGGKQELAAAD